jgi:glycosyltransferase involved in cell wall biosynthesis
VKVIFYYHYLGLGGVEATLLGRIVALRKYGVSGEYWFSRFYGDGAKYLSEYSFIKKVDLKSPDTFSQLEDADVVVVVDYPKLVEALEVRGGATPLIYETHASHPPALEVFYSVVENTRLSAIVVPSEFNKRQILKQRQPAIEPEVIRNCFNPSFLNIDSTSEFLLLGDIEGPIVLWVGRLEDEKNPQDLIRVAQGLTLSRPDIVFLMVGDTYNYDEYLAQLQADQGGSFPPSMRFIRTVNFDDMAKVYRKTAQSGGFLLSTSSFESAPMTFIESMVCRCPVISSNVGGVQELIEHELTGVLYNPGDIDAVVKMLEETCANDKSGLRQTIVENAFKYVTHNHLPEIIASRYHALLARVATDKRTGAAGTRGQTSQ